MLTLQMDYLKEWLKKNNFYFDKKLSIDEISSKVIKIYLTNSNGKKFFRYLMDFRLHYILNNSTFTLKAIPYEGRFEQERDKYIGMYYVWEFAKENAESFSDLLKNSLSILENPSIVEDFKFCCFNLSSHGHMTAEYLLQTKLPLGEIKVTLIRKEENKDEISKKIVTAEIIEVEKVKYFSIKNYKTTNYRNFIKHLYKVYFSSFIETIDLEKYLGKYRLSQYNKLCFPESGKTLTELRKEIEEEYEQRTLNYLRVVPGLSSLCPRFEKKDNGLLRYYDMETRYPTIVKISPTINELMNLGVLKVRFGKPGKFHYD